MLPLRVNLPCVWGDQGGLPAGETETPLPSSPHLPPTEDQLPPGFPNIDMGPQLKVVERTRTATMLCAASGNPDPEITWFKDFLPVDPAASGGRIKQLRSGSVERSGGGGEGGGLGTPGRCFLEKAGSRIPGSAHNEGCLQRGGLGGVEWTSSGSKCSDRGGSH